MRLGPPFHHHRFLHGNDPSDRRSHPEIDPELVSVFIKQKGAELAFGNWETDLIA